MAKANLTFPNGTTMNIDGTPNELIQVMEKIEKKGKKKLGQKKNEGPLEKLRILIVRGFFNEKRSINDIIEKFSESGFKYRQNQLSKPLLTMTRNEELKRKKENDIYFYNK